MATKEAPVVITKEGLGLEASVVHAGDVPFLAGDDDPVEPLSTEKKAQRMLRTALGVNKTGRLGRTFRQQGREFIIWIITNSSSGSFCVL